MRRRREKDNIKEWDGEGIGKNNAVKLK